MRKVAIFGAGNVGATAAFQIAERDLAHVSLIDIAGDMPAGKAMDMCQAGAIFGYDARVQGGQDPALLEGADVVVVTAGFPRQPGMDRMDLLRKNAGIARDCALKIRQYAPEAVIIVVTNPLDVMTWVVQQAGGFPPARVVGMAGVLDAARLAAFIAGALHCSPRDIRAMVLGGHGDSMVPLPRHSTVFGVPLPELLPPERVRDLVQRTRHGGAEIVKLLGTGSAFYAPAASVTAMVEAVLKHSGRLLPASAYLRGEYGLRDLYVGVPVRLGSGGVLEVVQLALDPEEEAALRASAASVRAGIEEVKTLLS